MNSSVSLWSILIGAILVNNFVLNRFLGICPFLGVSKRTEAALGMGAAVIFVMSLASTATWVVYHWVLLPLELEFLKIVSFILIIASLVQIVEIVLQKISPPLYRALGIYLPLITTNCAILGLTFLNIQKNYTFLQSLVLGLGAGIGFTLTLVIMAGIREKLELAPIPEVFKNVPIALITAGILSLAFMGFSGIVPM
jgi:electron transport complex protein RnfA